MHNLTDSSRFQQLRLLDIDSEPSETQKETKNALDQLFSLTIQYRSSQAYLDLLTFISTFKFYSPFNAFLIHTQKRGAAYVATPQRWLYDYGRSIKPEAQPIVILQPMGPVMFVFDVCETDEIPGAKDVKPLPLQIDKPYEVQAGKLKGNQLELVIENVKRDGVRITMTSDGSQSAGLIRWARNIQPVGSQNVLSGYQKNRKPLFAPVTVQYEMLVNANGQSPEAQYATIAHELAHLYCGHLGTPDIKLWPDRQRLNHVTEEFEAESVSFMVCQRQGIQTTSPEYLSQFVKDHTDIPAISMESVMKAAGLIESMSCQKMKIRKTQ
jgi:hypothetical protein